MSANRTCACGGQMTYRPCEHVEKVSGIKVTDRRGSAFVCDVCGEVELSLAELAGYQRRAAMTVLLDLPTVRGAVLRYARKALGLTQAALALLLGAQPETVSRWESDDAIPRDVQLALVGILTAVEHGLMNISRLQQNATASSNPEPTELDVLSAPRAA